jgi:dipeptidyl aminopeptidase/acylaminoacyl peptidase
MLKTILYNPNRFLRFGSAALIILIILCVFFIPLRPAMAQETPGYSVKEFLSQTTISEVAVSPSGNVVFFVTAKDSFEKDEQEITLWRMDADSSDNKIGSARPVYLSASCRGLQWSPDGRYLSFVSSRKPSDPPQLFLLDNKQVEPVAATSSETFKRGILTYDWSLDSKAMIFAVPEAPNKGNEKVIREFYGDVQRLPSDKPRTSFYRLEVADPMNRTANPLFTYDGFAGELKLSPDGSNIAFISGTTNVSEIEVHLLASSGKQAARRITSNFVIESRLQWSADGASLYVTTIGDAAARKVNYTQVRLNRIDVSTGETQRLAPDFNGGFGTAGFGNYILMPDGRLLAIGVDSTTANFCLVGAGKPGFKRVTSFRGMVSNLSASNDRKLMAFVLTDNKSYQELYLARGLDNLNSAFKATSLNANLESIPPPEIETISWPNGEGDVVEGVLYWPPGKRNTKNLPLIVDLHGGPWSMRTEAITVGELSYAYYPALLASRGYLVLEPNFRGSPGRGDKFLKALEGRSCSGPSTDTLTGVEHLVSKGWADTTRVGVMGTSFGGQITNCLIGRTARFRAACSGSGVWNDISYFGTADNTIQNDIRNLGKAPWEDMKTYWEESPISGSGNIRTPTLISIGGSDRRVPTAQAHEMYRAVVRAGAPCQLLIFPGEGHVLSKPSHRRTKVEAEMAWLDHYILNKPLPTFD